MKQYFNEMLFFAFLALQQTTTTTTHAQTETETETSELMMDCRLCPEEGQVPHNPSAVFQFGEETLTTCQSAFDLGIKNMSKSNCAIWQSQGTDLCQCGSLNDCHLCEDQSDLPFPNLEVVSNKSCADLQEDAIRDDPSTCTAWQQTYGNYCGCENPIASSSTTDNNNSSGGNKICRLCGDYNLVESTRIFIDTENALRSSGGKSCAELEFEANLPGADCETSQEAYSDCCLIDCPLCRNPEEVPQDLNAVFVAGTDIVSCQTALDYGTLRLPEETCQFWQSRGDTLCGCSSEQPRDNDCQLCGDGRPLPDPLREGLPATTCAVLQADAKRDDPSLCPVWQETVGNYCGCNNPVLDAEPTCHLCEGLELPNPLEMIDTRSVGHLKDYTSCGHLEFQSNLPQSDCELYQFMFKGCCRNAVDPNDVSDGSETSKWYSSVSKVGVVAATVVPYFLDLVV